MHVFAITQGAILNVFDEVLERLRRTGAVERVSWYVAGRSAYRRWIEQGAQATGEVVREWEVVERGRRRTTSPAEIAAWEERLGVDTLWPALVADRRMTLGRLAKIRQDYTPHRSLTELRGIAVETAETLWEAFDRARPDVVLGFVPVTVGDYLAYLVARARGVTYLHLKSTKIANYVTLSTDIHERHPHIRRRYHEYLAGEGDADVLADADAWLARATAGRVVYEGVLEPARRASAPAAWSRFLAGTPRALAADLREGIRDEPPDPQRVPRLPALWHGSVGKRLRMTAAEKAMAPAMLRPDALGVEPYVFYPLHSEPEIALSVYGRWNLNQIETVRNIAQSVPLGTLVVVKEHPRSFGLRSPGYYRRLREIPNVRFVPTELPTTAVIGAARAVVVVSGFAGFEAVLQGVPVVTLGFTPWDVLPETMVRHVADPESLAPTLRDLIARYRKDDGALRAFVAAVMHESVPVDLYGELLGKGGREGGSAIDTREEQLERLARYTIRRILEERAGAHAGGTR